MEVFNLSMETVLNAIIWHCWGTNTNSQELEKTKNKNLSLPQKMHKYKLLSRWRDVFFFHKTVLRWQIRKKVHISVIIIFCVEINKNTSVEWKKEAMLASPMKYLQFNFSLTLTKISQVIILKYKKKQYYFYTPDGEHYFFCFRILNSRWKKHYNY